MPQTLKVEHVNYPDVLQLCMLFQLLDSSWRNVHVGEEYVACNGWVLIDRSHQTFLEFGLCCAPCSLIRPASMPKSHCTPYRNRTLMNSLNVSSAVRPALGAPRLFSAVGPKQRQQRQAHPLPHDLIRVKMIPQSFFCKART